jgi:hypothetical protein
MFLNNTTGSSCFIILMLELDLLKDSTELLLIIIEIQSDEKNCVKKK